MQKTSSKLSWALVAAIAAALTVEPVAFAQQAAGTAPAASAPAASASSKIFSQKDLDELLAPIALYPDPLLAQVLMASTYPLEVVQAARWQKQNASLKDKQLEDAAQQQPWDPAVKALAAVPQVLTMMNEKLDWTTKLGDAVLAQQEDVMKTVQSLRRKADEAGNLKTSEQIVVTKETESNVQIIKIESPRPDMVYVPTYDPSVVYGPWWYPYPPPYYYYPPTWGYGYGYYPGLAFASGVFWGAAIAGGIGWGNNEININRNTNINNGNRNQGGNRWQHNPEHRKGANYRDSATAKKYNRGGDRQAAASREQFRGRADQGRQQLSQMDRGQLNRSVSGADRGAANRGASNRAGGGQATPRTTGASNRAGSNTGAGNRGGGSYGGATQRSSSTNSGFSGSRGGGASTRAASSRGSASRGGGGGGRGGGGRR